MKMELNFGSRYADLDGKVYKCIGNAKDFKTKDNEILFFAPIHAGTVGDVVYLSKSEVEKGGILFPISRFQ